jgi:hypothetical protein
MNINNYIEKLRALPDKQKKIIMWIIVAVLGIIMVFFWFNSAVKNISKIGEGFKSIELPQVETQVPSTEIQKDETVDWKKYMMSGYGGFEIKYPPDWNFIEYESGVEFHPKNNPYKQGIITVGFYGRGSDYCKIPFEDYVKIAAPSEIQGYESINTIEKIINSNGVEMYKTTWNYTDLKGSKKISLPITYFGIKAELCGGIEAFLNNSDYLDIYNKVIFTFKFTPVK